MSAVLEVSEMRLRLSENRSFSSSLSRSLSLSDSLSSSTCLQLLSGCITHVMQERRVVFAVCEGLELHRHVYDH